VADAAKLFQLEALSELTGKRRFRADSLGVRFQFAEKALLSLSVMLQFRPAP